MELSNKQKFTDMTETFILCTIKQDMEFKRSDDWILKQRRRNFTVGLKKTLKMGLITN